MKLLNMFHLVLIFDWTYKTKRYRLTLLEIVGVTSAKLIFSVWLAYFEHEKEANFKWELEKRKELYSYEKLLQEVLVTNWELFLMNVMEFLFPSSFYLLCVFCISKNISLKCKDYVKSNRQEHVMDLWNKVMYLNSEFEFEQNLHHFEIVCTVIPSLVEYMNQTSKHGWHAIKKILLLHGLTKSLI